MNNNHVYITRQAGDVSLNSVWKEYLINKITGKPAIFENMVTAFLFLHANGIHDLNGITFEPVDPAKED